jgi:hypothetical protein
MTMKVKRAAVALTILAAVMLTGCSADRWSRKASPVTGKASSPLPTATTYSQPKTSPKISLEIVEQFAGDVLSVATAGDLVYMGLGTRVVMVAEGIMIFDARSPVNLKLIGNLPLDGSPTSVTREGQWLYVTTDNSKLWVVDLSSPAAPRLVQYLNLPLTAHDMVVTKDYLYLAGGPGGILVVEKGSSKRVG